jgi:hypothetical protein
VVVEKGEYQGDPSKKMDKGKSSHASSVGSLVTLHKIVDRNDTAIKDPNITIKDHRTITSHQCAPGKPTWKQKKYEE